MFKLYAHLPSGSSRIIPGGLDLKKTNTACGQGDTRGVFYMLVGILFFERWHIDLDVLDID